MSPKTGPSRPPRAAGAASPPSPPPLGIPLSELETPELLRHSKSLGIRTLVQRRQFLATLPELDARGVFPRLIGDHGVVSLTTYGQLIGGASRHQVQSVLALARRLRPFPQVWRLYERGEVGMSVLDRIPSNVLAAEPDRWAEELPGKSRSMVVAMVEAERQRLGIKKQRPSQRPAPGAGRRGAPPPDPGNNRSARPERPGGRPGDAEPSGNSSGRVGKPHPEGGSPGDDDSPPPRSLDRGALSAQARGRLEVLRHELSKELGRNLGYHEILEELIHEKFLDTRPVKQARPTPGQLYLLEARAVAAALKAKRTGQTPVPVQRFCRVRAGDLCERRGCSNRGEQFHHRIESPTWRSRLPPGLRDVPRHHPEVVHLLCKACHSLLHAGRIANPHEPPENWELRPITERSRLSAVDREVQRRRRSSRARVKKPRKSRSSSRSSGA